jgi:hypothetical protein
MTTSNATKACRQLCDARAQHGLKILSVIRDFIATIVQSTGLPALTLETPQAQSWYSTTVPNRIASWNYDGNGNVLQEGTLARSFTYLLVDQQWNWRENQALGRRMKNAELRVNACVEDLDYRTARGLGKSVIRALTQESASVGTHENIFVLGPTGVGSAFETSAEIERLQCP